MTDKIKLKDFPQTFWIANTMEIFERMAWYGFFAVSSLYITGAVGDGGLGFSDEDRGVLQGVVTFFLYLFPVVSGALADRYGFKKMLFASFIVMVPAYYMLGQFKTFPTFFLAFMMVAIGASMFKPVIIGTISKVTNEKSASLGFGIFYMMVNIGGFVGPIVAGIVRAISWEYVFIASSGWIAVNFIFVTLFYKEPTSEAKSANPRSLKKVLSDMVEVLGNGRFFLFVFGLLSILVMGSKFTSDNTITWSQIIYISLGWVALNFIYDLILRKTIKRENQSWFVSPMKLGDWKFGLFLLLMSGFWTSFNQIFYTLPLYIRDFVDTSDLMQSTQSLFNFFGVSNETFVAFSNSMAVAGQFNPEYLINLNAGAIIFFQIGISYLVTRMKPFTTIFWGTMITVVSFSVLIFGTIGWLTVLGIVVFSFGEMMASPKSKEYTGRIAPPAKVALYMGYFYWCVALGNLFGGILSGQLYAAFARDMQRPDLMWMIFGIIALGSAMLILLYDKMIIRKS
ncbi:MAG: MFS transporter [Melioribacteraceae bacterium]|jgi:POT family proton-dependent oligopeptide transporter|nr:MFS transporter [Melioribacteraceae bacterium]